ncbi:MAG TPA: phage major capsid protein [Deltaproteobacteria bacterium]|nr:phage major capsid protein [Deltaproteobacteria bacterium]
MNDFETAQISRELERFYENKLRQLRRKDNGPRLSLTRAIFAAAEGRFRQGAPEEWEYWSRADGDPQRLALRWQDLLTEQDLITRDLAVGRSGAGGYLASAETPALESPLIPEAGVITAGARVRTRLVGDQLTPVTDALPDFVWLQTESSQLPTDATLTLGQRASTAKTGGTFIRVSYHLQKQSSIEQDLRMIVRLMAKNAIDKAAFSGSGASGEPLGLINVPGVNSVSGTSLGWTGITDLEEACLLGNANDERLTFFTTPSVKKLLRNREKASNTGNLFGSIME